MKIKEERRFIHKLKSQKGESIAETLLSTLIAALALVMLAGAISTTASILKTSDEKMADYYTQDAVLVAREEGGATRINVEIQAEGAGEEIDPLETRECDSYTNNAFASKPVMTYKVKTSDE